jgi:hypothetical protein
MKIYFFHWQRVHLMWSRMFFPFGETRSRSRPTFPTPPSTRILTVQSLIRGPDSPVEIPPRPAPLLSCCKPKPEDSTISHAPPLLPPFPPPSLPNGARWSQNLAVRTGPSVLAPPPLDPSSRCQRPSGIANHRNPLGILSNWNPRPAVGCRWPRRRTRSW